MDKSMLTGLVIGAVVATTGGVIAGFSTIDKQDPDEPAFAEVLSVEEIKKTLRTPREVCEDVPVTRQKPVQDENKIVGTVAGALLGGVLGNQIGEGSGKKIATLAGAAAGGYAGNKVQGNMQDKNTYTTNERRCHTVTDSQTIVEGYNVSYRLGDTEGSVRMEHDPGDHIPVAEGQLVLSTN